MKLYFPSYYNKFRCIAEKCRHSCCVGWEIGVDACTMEKYLALEDGEILSHIDDGEIKMCTDGRCPFLRTDGLCHLIAQYGEEYISEICREHPRFYHRAWDRLEMGIGASCEEACRLILSSDFADFDSVDTDIERLPDTCFDTVSHRQAIYALLLDKTLDFGEKIDKISAEYKLDGIFDDIDYWKGVLSGLELLKEEHRELISLVRIPQNTANQAYFERFFAYLVFRHLSVAQSEENLRAVVGFCILLTKILMGNTIHKDTSFEKICDIARIISEEIEYSEDNTAELIFEIECIV